MFAPAQGLGFSGASTGPPAFFQAENPPAKCATGLSPMCCAVCVASAERQPPLQKKMKRLSSANTGLWYGLCGSSQNSSMPRGQWKAPGMRPSRSSSRMSRRSTNTTSPRPWSLIASSRRSVSISRSAASISARNPVVMFCAMATSLVSRISYQTLPPKYPPARAGSDGSLRPREQLRAPPGGPEHHEAHPFVHGGVGTFEPIACDPERTCKILGPARAPVDRIGFDREAHAPERTDGARHVVRGRHQQPALAGLGIGDGFGEFRILGAVARAISGEEPARRNAEIFDQPLRQLGFGAAAVDDLGAAAREYDFGIRIFARELDRAGHALGRLVERDFATRQRDRRLERAAQHDDAVGRPAGRAVPRRRA